jgi:hypothetical protein
VRCHREDASELASRRRSTSSGPFTHPRCLTCPSVPVVSVLRRHRLTCPRQPAFTAGHQARYPAGYTRNDLVEGPVTTLLAFPLPFGCRRSLLGHPVPAQELGLPHGRLTTTSRWWTRTGFPRSTRVSYSRVGCPLDPGGDGVHTVIDESATAVCRLPAASLFVSPVLSSRPEELP